MLRVPLKPRNETLAGCSSKMLRSCESVIGVSILAVVTAIMMMPAILKLRLHIGKALPEQISRWHASCTAAVAESTLCLSLKHSSFDCSAMPVAGCLSLQVSRASSQCEAIAIALELKAALMCNATCEIQNRGGGDAEGGGEGMEGAADLCPIHLRPRKSRGPCDRR